MNGVYNMFSGLISFFFFLLLSRAFDLNILKVSFLAEL